MAGFPPLYGGIKSWFKADALPVVADNTPIASWVDSGPLGIPAVQADSTKQPLYRVSSLNGLPTVKFDGVNDFLKAPYGGTIPQPTTLIAVAAITTTTNQYIIDGNSTSNYALGRNAGLYYITGGGAGLAHPAAADTSFHIFVVSFLASTTSAVRVNGGAATSGGTIGNPILTALTMGASGGGVVPSSGSIAEAVVTAGALSLADINTWGDALALKWGVAWTTAT